MLHCYARCSTFEQGTKTTIEDQEAVCAGFGRMQGLTAFDIQVYRDVGVSGSTKLNTRPEGSKMLAAAQRDDTIIAAKMDRLFRSSIDALETAEALKKRGVHLVLLDMGTQSVMGDGPAKLFFSMLAAFAEFERGRLVERIMAGKAAKAAKGGFTGGRTPYGMRKIGAGVNARLEPDPEQQEHFNLIRERMALYGRWWSPRKTTRWFNQQGLRTRTGKPYTTTQITRMADIVRREDAQRASTAMPAEAGQSLQ